MTMEELEAAIRAARSELEAAQREPFSPERQAAEKAYSAARWAAADALRPYEDIISSVEGRLYRGSPRERAAARESLLRAQERITAFRASAEYCALRAAERAAWDAREEVSGELALEVRLRELEVRKSVLRDGPSKPTWWGKDEDGDYVG